MSNLEKMKLSRVRRTAKYAGMTVVISLALLAATWYASPFAALALVCGILWAALFRVVRELRTQQQTMDGYLDTVRDKYDSIIGVLCGAMNLRDDIKSLHTSRVSKLAATVASEMGLRFEDIRLLQKSAVLADIGKIEIAESILTKPGDLTGHEWDEMRRHPEMGYTILSGIGNLRDAGQIVLAHHERYDGQGYPHGLRGEEIPIEARILSVVDSYTAMTSDRPHRKKMSHEMAVKEILRNSLTQFDPEVVRAFVRCDERGRIVEATEDQEPQVVPVFGFAAAVGTDAS